MSRVQDQKSFWIAHRGGAYHRPENSRAAFDYIKQQGISHIETDIRLTGDHQPILCHDERITLNDLGNVNLRDMTLNKLTSSPTALGEPLYPLANLLKDFSNSLHFDLELKEVDAAEPVCKLLDDFSIRNTTFITSFIPEALELCRTITPKIPRGLLIDRLAGKVTSGISAVKAALLLDCYYILPQFKLLKPAWITSAQSEGLKILAWTVNDPADARRLIDMGIDGIISDRPDYLRDYFN